MEVVLKAMPTGQHADIVDFPRGHLQEAEVAD